MVIKSKTWLSVALLAGLLGGSHAAYGGAAFGGHVAYSQGALNRKTYETFTSYSTQGFVGYEFSRLQVHAFVQHMDLNYDYQRESYQGIYGISGLGISKKVLFTKGALSATIQVPLSSALVLLSETSGTVNGKDYIQSTLTTLSGGQGYQVIGGYQARLIGSTKKGSEKFYIGAFLSYLSHQFATQTTRIKTNNSVIAPTSPGTEAVDHKLTVLSGGLSLSYEL